MEHLTALDAAFLELEDAHVALHIGSAAVFEGPVPTTAEMISRYEHFVAMHPRYRQVIWRVPLDLRKPGWRRAVADLEFHLRRTAVPAPGRRRQLENLIGRIMSSPLDPDRPLWEAWIVEGLRGGQWALVFKVHHSIVDGVGGMQSLLELLDPGDGWPTGAATSRARWTDWSLPRAAGRATRRLSDAGRATARLPVSAARLATGIPAGIRALRFAPASTLTGPLGRSRTFRTLTVDQSHVDAVRGRFGGTVNDVVLAMVCRGFHGLLSSRGEELLPGAVRCMVPVNVRTDDEAGAGANKISFVLVDLPIDVDDTRDTYLTLRSRVRTVKRSSAKHAVEAGFALANRVPAPVASAFIAAVRQVPQRIVTTICTNVPGPRSTQTMCGRRLVALYPYVPIGDRVRIAVAVTSYGGRLHFGITCDQRSVRDADVFVDAMAAGLRDLVTYAGAGIPRARRSSPTPQPSKCGPSDMVPSAVPRTAFDPALPLA